MCKQCVPLFPVCVHPLAPVNGYEAHYNEYLLQILKNNTQHMPHVEPTLHNSPTPIP